MTKPTPPPAPAPVDVEAVLRQVLLYQRGHGYDMECPDNADEVALTRAAVLAGRASMDAEVERWQGKYMAQRVLKEEALDNVVQLQHDRTKAEAEVERLRAVYKAVAAEAEALVRGAKAKP